MTLRNASNFITTCGRPSPPVRVVVEMGAALAAAPGISSRAARLSLRLPLRIVAGAVGRGLEEDLHVVLPRVRVPDDFRVCVCESNGGGGARRIPEGAKE